jgi:dienelactone hydrolase
MSQIRQLAAIMFADIEGYTALMETDEARTTQLREKLKKKLETESSLHGGRIIKLSGDGALCSFDSAAECVRAALAVQLAMQEEPKVPLRIGIHQADVVFEDSDVYGDGVNIASRLESLAVAGSIFISAKVYDDIKNQKDLLAASLGKYLLKNVKEPVEIFAVSNLGITVPHKVKLEGKGQKYREKVSRKRMLVNLLLLALLIAVSAVGWVFVFNPWIKKQHAKNELIPAIQKIVNETFRPTTAAFDMAVEAEQYIPGDSVLTSLWPLVSTPVSMETEPAGASVYWKDYNGSDTAWRFAGTTPLNNVKFPRSFLRMEIRKSGYQTIEYAGPSNYSKLGEELALLKLDKAGTLPQNMVRIPAGITPMYIVGLEVHGNKTVGAFLMDKFEVTNAAFKKFLDDGGYINKSYWTHPIYQNGQLITTDAALALFVDRTGRPGPANWEAGTFPDGKENHPVTGVSWYEAAAYAAYAQKQLPTVFHFGRVAETSRTDLIVPLSNFNGRSTTEVGSMIGYNTFGIYDLAGNAREWCLNESNDAGFRYMLGGGWNDPLYSFNDGYTQPAIDRSVANGFRCIKQLQGDTTVAYLTKQVGIEFRDYKKEKPVDDKTFGHFVTQFNYDKTPLNAVIESTVEGETWKAEKLVLDAAYNKEKLQVYIYLPKKSTGPFQPVIFFPGSNAIYSKKFDPQFISNRIDFILKSGRAIVIPIFKGTHERHDELKSDLPNESVFYKDHVVMWRKDIGRTIDYLETRKDIQADKLAYLGWSWGGYMGGIIPAVETRFKALVLNVGGMVMNRSLPEADQLNYLPRVKQPILMLNGKYDMFFPLETSQKPMFNFLGTAKEDKKMIIYEAGHLVPRTDFVKETLAWYDKYLGPVK